MFFSTITAWLLHLFPVPIVSTPHPLELALSTLQPHLSPSATITFPWDSRWADLQTRATSPRLAPHYSVVIEVATESDVQATVALASRLEIPFLAVSGGHGWTKTLDRVKGGIQINLRKLNSTVLGKDGKTVVVGGGALQFEVVRALFESGKYTSKWHVAQELRIAQVLRVTQDYEC